MFTLGKKSIGPGLPTLIFAEIGQAHDGSLGTAFSLVDAVADSGCDGVKFQVHFAEDESTVDDTFRVDFSVQDDSRYEYWKRIEFTEGQWGKLIDHSRNRNLLVACSTFSERAISLIGEIGVDAIKISSGELYNQSLLHSTFETELPIFLSTGMSTILECDEVVASIVRHTKKLVIFQCSSQYPTPLESVGLNMLEEFRQRYNLPVGLSDHSGVLYPGIYAVTTHAAVLEVHATFDKSMFGPDVSSSLTFSELEFLSKLRDGVERMESSPVNKDDLAGELSEVRGLFTRSVALRKPLDEGAVLHQADLVGKKPGLGIPWADVGSVVGKRLNKSISHTQLLSWSDLEN
jgi:N,N'-diacetyllegionaminate synthase